MCLHKLRKKIVSIKAQDVAPNAGGMLSFREIVSVPRVNGIIQRVLIKSRGLWFSMHSGVTNKYKEWKQFY